MPQGMEIDKRKDKKLMARILIIDDDLQILTMLKLMLEHEGYEVTTAGDGKSGVKSYRKNPADLVITDIIMPDQEGLETISELRQDFPDLRIIAMSGGGRIDSGQYLNIAKEFGANCIFTKPIEREKLVNAVKKLLE